MEHDTNELMISFRKGGTASQFRMTGWSDPEANETWCIGARSSITLPSLAAARAHSMILRVRPFVHEQRLPAQRLLVRANGVLAGSFRLTKRTVRACIIPPAAIKPGEPLVITFETPDAARPADLALDRDTRALAVAFTSIHLCPDRAAAPAPPATNTPVPIDVARVMRADQISQSELMLMFESLGQNCEFGLVQRKCEAEPLGLLRFASAPLANLIAALEAGFAGMDEPSNIVVEQSPNGREYMLRDARYGITYHAWVNTGEMDAAELHRREIRRVPFLVRKLLEDLASGDKIFVLKGMGALAEEEVYPVAVLLRRYGPNTLLFVTLADDAHPAGRVVQREPGFMVGAIDRFAPAADAHAFDLGQWLKLCRDAYRLKLASPPAR